MTLIYYLKVLLIKIPSLVSPGYNQDAGWTAFLSGGSRGQPVSLLIQVVGTAPFLAVVQLRSYFLAGC